MERLRQQQAVTVPLEEERPAEIGDVVVVDYESFVDDKPLDGNQATNVEVELGAGQTQQEIEVALVKAAVGDTRQAVVSYPEDSSNRQVRARKCALIFRSRPSNARFLPELDDDFARGVSPEFKDLDALTMRIRKEIEDTYKQQKDMAMRNQILDHIRELGEFDLPQSLWRKRPRRCSRTSRTACGPKGLIPTRAIWSRPVWSRSSASRLSARCGRASYWAASPIRKMWKSKTATLTPRSSAWPDG